MHQSLGWPVEEIVSTPLMLEKNQASLREQEYFFEKPRTHKITKKEEKEKEIPPWTAVLMLWGCHSSSMASAVSSALVVQEAELGLIYI